MQVERPRSPKHEHTVVILHALRQRSGIPYEVERQVCSACRQVLEERRLRRTAA
ncbi:MAG: hypothetical protein ICV67_05610 [Thermoleophilia bacterium]|nr:hypothetical protein [Thermoleophilia bacterium]